MFQSSSYVFRIILRQHKILFATTKTELIKRYAGSVIGVFWLILQPLLLLSVYLFVYLVVFKMSIPGYSKLDYVLYVFAGLVPFIGFSEALQIGTLSVKQNLHLVKNVMLPIELIPIRAVIVALAIQSIMVIIVIALSILNGGLSSYIFLLPLVLLLQFMLLLGLVFVLSAIALVFQDITQFINLILMLLMFLSPIGFAADMLPSQFNLLIYTNPVSYMIDSYRFVLIENYTPTTGMIPIYISIALATFMLGSAFFEKFKGVLVDYE